MKKALFYDVMSGGRFVCTMRYDYLPCFGVKLEEIYAQLIAKRPSLRSKRFSIFIDEFQFDFEPDQMIRKQKETGSKVCGPIYIHTTRRPIRR